MKTQSSTFLLYEQQKRIINFTLSTAPITHPQTNEAKPTLFEYYFASYYERMNKDALLISEINYQGLLNMT